MIFRQINVAIFLFIGLLLLAGCPGLDEEKIESGIVVSFAELHLADKTSAQSKVSVNSASSISARATEGGFDDNLPKRDIVDVNGKTVSLYRAYVMLDGIKLVACTDISAIPKMILNSIFPVANAHTSEGGEAVNGRGLDRPNVIDILTEDNESLALGNVSIAPGKYCGITVSVVRLVDGAYGKPEVEAESNDNPTSKPGIPDLSGFIFSAKADYCTAFDSNNDCVTKSKLNLNDRGTPQPLSKTIQFDQAIELNASQREANVVIGIEYGNWMKDVDASLVGADNDEIQKMLDNIVESIYVHTASVESP